MPKIKCHEESCQNNYCSHCTRDCIEVSESAACCSYQKKDENCDCDNTRLQEEYGSENDVSILDEHFVECNANDCQSNFSGVCSLNQVRVGSKDCKGKCVSYHHR